MYSKRRRESRLYNYVLPWFVYSLCYNSRRKWFTQATPVNIWFNLKYSCSSLLNSGFVYRDEFLSVCCNQKTSKFLLIYDLWYELVFPCVLSRLSEVSIRQNIARGIQFSPIQRELGGTSINILVHPRLSRVYILIASEPLFFEKIHLSFVLGRLR